MLTSQSLSDTVTFTVGVPQRSILGPLLFLVCINDMPLSIEQSSSHMLLYADNATISATGRDVNEVDDQFSYLVCYCSRNGAVTINQTHTFVVTAFGDQFLCITVPQIAPLPQSYPSPRDCF